MKQILRVILVGLSMMALFMSVAFADEPIEGSPEDNACNSGGQMEGKCDSEWHWVCGYYMARFYSQSYDQGGYDTSLVPDWCASLLPPAPEPAVPGSVCIVTVNGNDYVVPTFVLSGKANDDYIWNFLRGGWSLGLNAEKEFVWDEINGWMYPTTGPCGVIPPTDQPN